ncbi:unnamed protein product, partial [marine sediment metagenome]
AQALQGQFPTEKASEASTEELQKPFRSSTEELQNSYNVHID